MNALKKSEYWGTWVAQSVKHPTSAQIMISQFMSLSPMWSSVLIAWSLGPASVLCLPLSLCFFPTCALSLSKINKHLKNKQK